jgi:hypothetical protein
MTSFEDLVERFSVMAMLYMDGSIMRLNFTASV